MPATGLNFTSTNPSLIFVSFLKQIWNVAWPDCFKTFGLLGAEASFSTVHFALPLLVCVAVQPAGAALVFMLSKLAVSVPANAVAVVITPRAKSDFFIVSRLI